MTRAVDDMIKNYLTFRAEKKRTVLRIVLGIVFLLCAFDLVGEPHGIFEFFGILVFALVCMESVLYFCWKKFKKS